MRHACVAAAQGQKNGGNPFYTELHIVLDKTRVVSALERRQNSRLQSRLLLGGEVYRRRGLAADEGRLPELVAELAPRRVEVRVRPAGAEVVPEAGQRHARAAVALAAEFFHVRAHQRRRGGLDAARLVVHERLAAERADALRRLRGLGAVVLEAAAAEDVLADARRDRRLEDLRAYRTSVLVVEFHGQHLRRLGVMPRDRRGAPRAFDGVVRVHGGLRES